MNTQPDTEKRERRKQRGLWQRRHRLNLVERETLYNLNKKYGTYTGPKAKAHANPAIHNAEQH